MTLKDAQIQGLNRFQSVSSKVFTSGEIGDDDEAWAKRAGSAVLRISLDYIYNVAARLEPIQSLPVRQTPIGEIQFVVFQALGALTELTSTSLYAPHLRVSFNHGNALLGSLRSLLMMPGDTRVLTELEILGLKTTFSQYRTALLSELGVLNSYFVAQKGAFDMLHMLSQGETLFPSDLVSKVPEALFDAREAGKCLAYENATASGFHLFRVLETVIRKYYSHETGGKAQPKTRNISVYVNALRQMQKGDEKTLVLLKEISDRYRNPLVHPDAALSVDDAIAVLGLVRLAIAEMLRVLPTPQSTTLTGLFSQQA